MIENMTEGAKRYALLHIAQVVPFVVIWTIKDFWYAIFVAIITVGIAEWADRYQKSDTAK